MVQRGRGSHARLTTLYYTLQSGDVVLLSLLVCGTAYCIELFELTHSVVAACPASGRSLLSALDNEPSPAQEDVVAPVPCFQTQLVHSFDG